MRITNREIEWYDDVIRAIEEDYYIDETNDVMYRKLKALEDLEEEIGIDLITLFKALKQKFVFHKENVKIELLGIHIKSGELCLYGFVEDTTHGVYLSLKEYGKTWVLTREELENEKRVF